MTGLESDNTRDGAQKLSRRDWLTGLAAAPLVSGCVESPPTELSPGEEVWEFEAEEEGDVRSPLTVADGSVYAGTTNPYLYKMDAATGDEVWSHNVSDSLFSEPISHTVADGMVYITHEDMYALETETFTEQWRFNNNDFMGRSPPTVVGGSVYVGNGDDDLISVDATTGEKEWAFETDTDLHSSPTVADGTIYVGGENLYALDIPPEDDYDYKWKISLPDHGDFSVALADQTVYAVANAGNGQRCLAADASTGNSKWSFDPGTTTTITTAPTVADRTVYVGAEDGNLYALDASTGAEEWAFETGAAVESSPAVADGTVYVGSNDGNLYAVDARTGEQKWQFADADSDTGAPIKMPPTVVDDTVYFGNVRGRVYAVTTETRQSP